MTTITRIAAALALAAAPATLAAQDAAPAAAGSIVGFSAMPWGSSEAAIRARFGTPANITESAGLRMLAFEDRIMDIPTGVWFYMHPQQGLVAGAYTAPFGYGDECWSVYTKFRDAVSGRYPNIRPRLAETNQARSLSFCDALRINRASAAGTWDDRENGGRVWININANDRYVQTMYLSAQGIRAILNADAAERQERF
jgi:hypothetical protein